jgi:hypothetical protein
MRSLVLSAVLAVAALAPSPSSAVRVQNLTAQVGPPERARVRCLGPVRLDWTLPASPPTGGISEIRVYRRGVRVKTLPANATVYRASGEHFFPGDTYAYQIALLNGAGVEEPDRASVSATIPECDPAPSRIRVLVMLFDFSDYPADPGLDPDDVHEQFFEAPDSPAEYLYHSSYGQTELFGDVSPLMRMPLPFDFYENPGTPSCPLCGNGLVRALQIAAQNVPNLADYDRHVFLFTRINGLSIAAGTTAATAQGTITTVGYVSTIGSGVNWKTANHELGHNIGMDHASSWYCGAREVGPSLDDLTAGDCNVYEYDDRLDPMGVDLNGKRDFGAYNKLLAGHFGLDQVKTVVAASLSTTGVSFWIDRLERESGGTKLLRVDLGGGSSYLIENRHQGPSQYMDEIDKVVVRLLPSHTTGPGALHGAGSSTLSLRRDNAQLFLKPLGSGFYDTYRRVRISVLETRIVGNVHQARVMVARIPAGCGLIGIEAVPFVAAVAAAHRRARRRAARRSEA